VSPELVEVRASGAPTSKWQQPFDAALTDVFRVQSEIATQVARSLGGALGVGEEKRLAETPTANLTAYDAFLKGEEAFAFDPASLRKAVDLYEKAVALDPGFALAWGEIAVANSLRYANFAATPEIAERAREAAEKAVALAPNRPEGHHALGHYYLYVRRDPRRARQEYTEGQRLAPGSPDEARGIAYVDEMLGHWEEALERSRQAERLDPRGVFNIRNLGIVLSSLHRWSEARQVLDRGLALAPANLGLIELKAHTFLGEGDLSSARALLKEAQSRVEPTALVAQMALFDVAWVLDSEQAALLRRLTSAAFDDDEGTWAICQAEACAFAGDAAGMRDYAERARKAFEVRLQATPDDSDFMANHAHALAYLGRKEEAIRESKRASALRPLTQDAYAGPYFLHQLARVYILVGEQEKALDVLEPLLKVPYVLSPGWLRIDPNFDPLRKNPRFQKLVAGAK
jgi:tetratricopeptide (TPR) repeat protein